MALTAHRPLALRITSLVAFVVTFIAAATGGISAAQAVTATQACPHRAPVPNPLNLYGNGIAFDVYRNGDRVGEHVVDFRVEGDSLVARTRFELTVDILFITAYRFVYESVDRWRDGCLQSLAARTEENGEEWTVTAERVGSRMRVEGPAGTTWTTAGIFPTNHYNPGVIGSEQVLNTITGGIDDVRIVDKGASRVPVNDETGERPARHYAYTGDLTNEVWYADGGRWVGMRFQGKDGSTIELRCRSCGDGSTASR